MNKNKTIRFPQRYTPKTLNAKDLALQKSELLLSRKMYRRGKYHTRVHVNSFRSKPSNHVERARNMYGVNVPSAELARKTKCSKRALEKIVNKGRGAYYSSGSRPNQTAESWGLARLASAVTGGNASLIDYSILQHGCSKDSPALRLATELKKKKEKQ